jgi:hypothetical protein
VLHSTPACRSNRSWADFPKVRMQNEEIHSARKRSSGALAPRFQGVEGFCARFVMPVTFDLDGRRTSTTPSPPCNPSPPPIALLMSVQLLLMSHPPPTPINHLPKFYSPLLYLSSSLILHSSKPNHNHSHPIPIHPFPTTSYHSSPYPLISTLNPTLDNANIPPPISTHHLL